MLLNINFTPLVNQLLNIFHPKIILSIMGIIVGSVVSLFIVLIAGRLIIIGFENIILYGEYRLDSFKEGQRQKYFAKHGKIPNW